MIEKLSLLCSLNTAFEVHLLGKVLRRATSSLANLYILLPDFEEATVSVLLQRYALEDDGRLAFSVISKMTYL